MSTPMPSAAPVSSAAFGALGVDLHGLILYCNALAEDMTGYTFEEALNRPLDSVLKIAGALLCWQPDRLVQKAIEDDQAVVPAAHGSLVNRAGEEYLVEYSAAPIHSRDGRVSGAMIVFRNVTVRQRTDTVRREAHHATVLDARSLPPGHVRLPP